MACRIYKAGERSDLISRNTQIKPQTAAFGQVILSQREQSERCGHDVLPGQGNATVESLAKSTLA